MPAYRELIENAPDAIVVIAGGTIRFANEAAKDLVGLSGSEIPADLNVLEFIHPDSRSLVLDLIRSPEAQPAMNAVPVLLVRRDGAVRDAEFRMRRLNDDGVESSVVFVRDVTDRNRAERALASSEARYRQVVESMNEALVVYDDDGRAQFVNDQYCRLFGVTPEQVIGSHAIDIFAPETAALVVAAKERRRQGESERYEATMETKSGSRVAAHISAAPLYDGHRFAGSLALVYDITARKEAEAALHRSERRYQHLLDSSPNFIFSLDPQGRFVAANLALCRAIGVRESAVIGRTPADVQLCTTQGNQIADQVKRTCETRQSQTGVYAFTPRGGSLSYILCTTSPSYDDDRRIAGITGIGVDVTEDKKREDARQKLLRAVEQMDEVMVTTDPSGAITHVNPAFERVYGYARDEVLGRTMRMVKSGEMPAGTYEQFWAELLGGGTLRKEFVNRRKDGGLVRVVSTVSPIHDSDGSLTGFTAVQRDITAERVADAERRVLEQRFAELVKMQALGTLAGGIAHDFNNILSIMLTHATIAERSAADPARLAKAIGTIKQAVKRGATISRQILTFARKAEMLTEPLRAGDVVQEIGSMIGEMFPRNIQVIVDAPANLPLIKADASRLHQALLNLCVNARDAMPDGGTLNIRVGLASNESVRELFPEAAADDHVSITVSDTGSGMSKATLSRIFEPFFTTKEHGKGTGLGLAVVYGIVKSHDGQIHVKSEIGAGTEFCLLFPALTAASAAEESQTPLDLRGSETVLIVDDEVDIGLSLASEVSRYGYKVISATTSAEAVRALEMPVSIDVIVSDLGLPSISSPDLIKLLRAHAPGVPIIPMTGYIEPELHAVVRALGAGSVLQKPFVVEELLRRIRQAAAERNRV